MPEPALKIDFTSIKLDTGPDLKGRIRQTHTEEIIIGLCGPIGTDIHFVAQEFAEAIEEKYQYKATIIKLSNFIKKLGDVKESDFKSKFDYINKLR